MIPAGVATAARQAASVRGADGRWGIGGESGTRSESEPPRRLRWACGRRPTGLEPPSPRRDIRNERSRRRGAIDTSGMEHSQQLTRSIQRDAARRLVTARSTRHGTTLEGHRPQIGELAVDGPHLGHGIRARRRDGVSRAGRWSTIAGRRDGWRHQSLGRGPLGRRPPIRSRRRRGSGERHHRGDELADPRPHGPPDVGRDAMGKHRRRRDDDHERDEECGSNLHGGDCGRGR